MSYFQLLVKSNDTEMARRYAVRHGLRPLGAYELTYGEQIVYVNCRVNVLQRWFNEQSIDTTPFPYGTLLYFNDLGIESIDCTDPRVKVNGVEYTIRYGNGWARERTSWGVEICPVYVWCAVLDPEYSAPKHVSDKCNRVYELGCEIAEAERRAGWPSV